MKFKFRHLLFLSILTAGVGGVYYYVSHQQERFQIKDFEYNRDASHILELFEKHWYWLVEGDNFEPDAMLKYQAPNGNPQRANQMHIKTLYDNNNFVGFTSYYPKSNNVWWYNFVAIKEDQRAKGHASRLVHYAIDDMKSLGAKVITLVTRTSNIGAQKVYKRAGFKETYRNDGFVYFAYDVK